MCDYVLSGQNTVDEWNIKYRRPALEADVRLSIYLTATPVSSQQLLDTTTAYSEVNYCLFLAASPVIPVVAITEETE